VFDTAANGQQLKCLTVTDEWTNEGLAIEVEGQIRSKGVIDVLARLVALRGAPAHLRSDNGPEFISRAILKWIVDAGINSALIDLGKPWQNGKVESFNGKFRDECLNVDYFRSRAEAKAMIETWRRHYNEVRPHSGLKYLTPNEYVAKGAKPEDRARQRAGALRDVCTSQPGPLPEPMQQAWLMSFGSIRSDVVFDNVAVFHGDDAVGHVEDAGIVGHHQGCRAPCPAEAFEQVHDLVAADFVECCCWLVSKDDVRVADERACDGNTLLLSAGEFGGEVVQPVCKPEQS
jgi:hypothetical protein